MQMILTEPISKVLNGITYTAYPNSVLISSESDPYQGTYEVDCVIGTYEDVSGIGPAMVFYGNDGEICYGVRLKDKYFQDTLDNIWDGIFNGFNGVCKARQSNAVYSVISNQNGFTLTNHSDSELNFMFYHQIDGKNIELTYSVKSGEVVKFTKSPITNMLFDDFNTSPDVNSDESYKFSVNGANLNIAKKLSCEEYEINGKRGFFVRSNFESHGKEAVRKRLADLYGCETRNLLFKSDIVVPCYGDNYEEDGLPF